MKGLLYESFRIFLAFTWRTTGSLIRCAALSSPHVHEAEVFHNFSYVPQKGFCLFLHIVHYMIKMMLRLPYKLQ